MCVYAYVCAGVGIWVGVYKYMPVCMYAEHRELNTGIRSQHIHTHTNTHNTHSGWLCYKLQSISQYTQIVI